MVNMCPAALSPEASVTSLETFKTEADIGKKGKPCYTLLITHMQFG